MLAVPEAAGSVGCLLHHSSIRCVIVVEWSSVCPFDLTNRDGSGLLSEILAREGLLSTTPGSTLGLAQHVSFTLTPDRNRSSAEVAARKQAVVEMLRAVSNFDCGAYGLLRTSSYLSEP